MARPDKLPKILTEEETDRLLSEPNRRYYGLTLPCFDGQ
jgi:integrase